MAVSCKPRILAVVGPTATGKTALGVALAQALGGEIISADSMQIYRGLNVGTAKVTEQEAGGVPHYGVDLCPPEQPFSVADFVALANGWQADIAARGKLPILVGGTGLYVESFLRGTRFAPEKADPALRRALEEQLAEYGAQEMYRRLQAADPQAAAEIHPNNTVRVLRALEHYQATGRPLSEQKAASLPDEPPYRALVLGLDLPERAELYRRIDRRVDRMMAAGLADEAAYVYANRTRFLTAAQAIGYKEFFPWLAGEKPLDECVAQLKQASRRYAKRQLTWFRHMKQICWLDAGAPDLTAQAQQRVARWLAEE